MPVRISPTRPTMPTVRPLARIASTSRNGRFSPRNSCTISKSPVLLLTRKPKTE
jgi:hypothetical protein